MSRGKCLSRDVTTVASAQFASAAGAHPWITSCSLVDIDSNRQQS
jgi:hypothetical protein